MTKEIRYSVRPVSFWMDKILEKENKRPLTQEAAKQERQLMSDSYMEEYLPFKSRPELLEEYISTGGNIRIGKILEDLDSLAGSIGYKHADTKLPGPPTAIVTASVDRMELLLPNNVEDLKISGHVAYVGSSSMEVFVKVETMQNYDPSFVSRDEPPVDFMAKPTPNTVLFARFTMVCIDSVTGKSAKVNPLYLANDEEKSLFKFAQDSKMRKRLASDTALSKAPPTAEERLAIHDLYMKYSKFDKKEMLPKEMVWMEDTYLQSVFLMQPQDRNIHNKIFGGYLMRRAYELAHATGRMFTKSQIRLLSLDEILFRKAVPVGTYLNLHSQITYARGDPEKSFEVSVTAEVKDVDNDTTDVTNTFHFTFATADKPVPSILPRTYAESMSYLEGKRRDEHGVMAKKELLELMGCRPPTVSIQG
ncbi:HotDog domain-containing protein [Radiomyces spectabilis]|uniref:HotDog domain-containing protein n=1 Tax=Radiomyces spectabilis TaxID=64574 RepID=UPI00221EFEC7|nr:HotDog domain-containing protein [Radiomyces spectabilis]KAI8391169.1 HotDog domain-containing protein [Radiomyces spectabilis]